MDDAKITQLPELAAAAATDVLPIVCDPTGLPVNKKITFANLFAGYLPYNGATNDVILGSHALTTTGIGTFGKIILDAGAYNNLSITMGDTNSGFYGGADAIDVVIGGSREMHFEPSTITFAGNSMIMQYLTGESWVGAYSLISGGGDFRKYIGFVTTADSQAIKLYYNTTLNAKYLYLNGATGGLAAANHNGLIKWQGGSQLLEQTAAFGGVERMLYTPNGDWFDVLDETGTAYIASFRGPGASASPNTITLYTAGLARYAIDASGNHDFKAGNITTTGNLNVGSSATAATVNFDKPDASAAILYFKNLGVNQWQLYEGSDENMTLQSLVDSKAWRVGIKSGSAYPVMRYDANGLGINNDAPSSKLDIIAADSTAYCKVTANRADNGGSGFIFRRSRGNIASPAAVASGDYVSAIFASGYDGSAYKDGAVIYALVDGAVAANSVPTKWQFLTTKAGDTVASVRLTLEANGDITLGSGVAGYDQILTFDGETNDGVLTWMEDEDYFKSSDDILLNSTEHLYFNDTSSYIYDDGTDLRFADSTTGEKRLIDLTVPVGGTIMWDSDTPPDGWLIRNGQTIGDASSSATARANADCAALFAYLWNNIANAQLPIQDSSGNPTTRGVSAAADFAAHKRMPLPNGAGRVPVGKDAGTFATLGAALGEETHQLTTDELAQHSHSTGSGVETSPGSGYYGTATDGAGSTGNTGSGVAHNNIQPSLVTNFIIRYR